MKVSYVCRCCLSEECFKDISNEYYIAGVKEVYADLLLNTFNIHISYQRDSSRLICEDCVVKLRESAAFKLQVEKAERAIIDGNISCVFKDPNIDHKAEYKDDFLDYITGKFEDDCCDDDANLDDHFNDDHWWPSDDEPVIKQEPIDDLTPSNRTTKLKNRPKTGIAIQKPVAADKTKTKKKTNDKSEKGKTKRKRKTLSQLNLKENSLKLINNSNICLFESLKTKFRCFYCKNFYLNISELREHSAIHSNPSYLKMCINRLQGMSFKNVDISNLSCKVCSENLKDLDELRCHLIDKHNIAFSGENHMLIPYRLEQGFDCAKCDQKFNTFFRLSIHMNSHFTNHVCEICGVSYINRLSLRMHVSSMHKEKKCSMCPLTFSNTYSRVKHMRKVHNSGQAKRYCLLCDKTFRYTYMLDEHKIQEHGAKRQIAVCQECGKTFLTAVNLRTHIRAVHIRERNHACAHCGMSFFTSCDRRRHERTHQDVRLFACSYCEGRFKSKDSLRRHLKRQHGSLFSTAAENFSK